MATWPALAAETAEHGAKAGMPQLDPNSFMPQLVWLAITFVILYLLMSRVALPRISEVLEERQNRVAHDLQEAERLKIEAEKASSDYEKALTLARAEAQSISAETRERLGIESTSRRAEEDAQLNEQIRQAEAEIAAARNAALGNVRQVAAEAAGDVVQRLIGVEVKPMAATAAVQAVAAEQR
jgi:F-type H+-transporting ATPase subunit b